MAGQSPPIGERSEAKRTGAKRSEAPAATSPRKSPPIGGLGGARVGMRKASAK